MKTIRGTTAAGVGITYIPIDRYSDHTTIQCVANGTVTYEVDRTSDNILYDATALEALNLMPNHQARVAAASAAWSNIIPSGATSSSFMSESQSAALRINITAGTGSVTYTIAQNGR